MDESSNVKTQAEPAPDKANPAGGVNPAADPVKAAAPSTPRHSWLYHVFNFLLGQNTTLGRIMRPLLRTLAAVVGLFALGLMAGYMLLYQPTQKSLDSASDQVTQNQAQVSRLNTQVAQLQSTLSAANMAVSSAQGTAAKAQAQNNLLVVIYDVANARTYLAQKDGANLIAMLDKAQTDLAVVQPYIVTAKKDLSDELTSRMQTVRSVVVRDATLAQSDLENLYKALLTANDLLFGAGQ